MVTPVEFVHAYLYDLQGVKVARSAHPPPSEPTFACGAPLPHTQASGGGLTCTRSGVASGGSGDVTMAPARRRSRCSALSSGAVGDGATSRRSGVASVYGVATVGSSATVGSARTNGSNAGAFGPEQPAATPSTCAPTDPSTPQTVHQSVHDSAVLYATRLFAGYYDVNASPCPSFVAALAGASWCAPGRSAASVPTR